MFDPPPGSAAGTCSIQHLFERGGQNLPYCRKYIYQKPAGKRSKAIRFQPPDRTLQDASDEIIFDRVDSIRYSDSQRGATQIELEEAARMSQVACTELGRAIRRPTRVTAARLSDGFQKNLPAKSKR